MVGESRWPERVTARRARADALLSAEARPVALPVAEAQESFARLRRECRVMLDLAASAYADLCPAGYPQVEDNQIEGAGGSVGIRFSAWHAFFLALQRAPRPKKTEPKASGLAGALDIRMKRMPGDPLPPPDPNVRLELATLSLRWDTERGWVEIRRVLPREWRVSMVEEQFDAYLTGFNYDVAAGLPLTGR